MKTFSESWVWLPGFYSLLHFTLGISAKISRYLSFSSFFIWGFILWINFLKTKRTKENLLDHLIYLFTGLLFFSPVYNAWYIIWYLPFALIRQKKSALLYALFSSFCYLPHGHMDYARLGEFFAHIWFVLILRDFYLAYVQVNRTL